MLNTILIIFINLTLILSHYSFTVLNHKQISNDIQHMLLCKNIEITMLYNYEKEYKEEGILMSSQYEYEDTTINSYIDNMGTYYEILTEINLQQKQYSFKVKLNLETGNLYNFEYN